MLCFVCLLTVCKTLSPLVIQFRHIGGSGVMRLFDDNPFSMNAGFTRSRLTCMFLEPVVIVIVLSFQSITGYGPV